MSKRGLKQFQLWSSSISCSNRSGGRDRNDLYLDFNNRQEQQQQQLQQQHPGRGGQRQQHQHQQHQPSSPPSDTGGIFDSHCFATTPSSSNGNNSDIEQQQQQHGRRLNNNAGASPTSQLLMDYEEHLRNTLEKGLDAESYSLHTFEALLTRSMENLGEFISRPFLVRHHKKNKESYTRCLFLHRGFLFLLLFFLLARSNQLK